MDSNTSSTEVRRRPSPEAIRRRNAKRRAARRRAAVGRVFVFLLLAAILGGSLYGAWILRQRTETMAEEGQQRVAAAGQALNEAKAAYAAIDPNTTQGSERQLEAQQEIVAAARQEAEELQQEINALDESIAAAEKDLANHGTDEESQYFRSLYDTYREGMEKVEGYLEGN